MNGLAWFRNVVGKLQGLRDGVERRSIALTYFQTAKKHKNSGRNFWARSGKKKKIFCAFKKLVKFCETTDMRQIGMFLCKIRCK
jgi:hypothetical protein